MKKPKKNIHSIDLGYFTLLTGDKYETGKLFEEPMAKGEFIKLTPEMFADLREKAIKTYALLTATIRPMMNEQRATHVKQLRITGHYSWRSIAAWCWTAWFGKWTPPTNQLAGKAICEIASEILDEIID